MIQTNLQKQIVHSKLKNVNIPSSIYFNCPAGALRLQICRDTVRHPIGLPAAIVSWLGKWHKYSTTERAYLYKLVAGE